MEVVLPRLPDPTPIQKADALFVCGASVMADSTPFTEMQTRLLHSYELLGSEVALGFLVARLAPPRPSYLPVVRRQLANLRLHPILLETSPVERTHDEALSVAAIMRERGSVILVSHWPRLATRDRCVSEAGDRGSAVRSARGKLLLRDAEPGSPPADVPRLAARVLGDPGLSTPRLDLKQGPRSLVQW